MASTGRKLDPLWADFDKIAPNKVRCRKCTYEVAQLLDRMKKTYQQSSYGKTKPISKQPRITQCACSTTIEQKEQFDLDIGRFFFSNIILFRAIESSRFMKLVIDLHHGYQPPPWKVLRNQILDDVDTEEQDVAKKLLGKLVTICVDGCTKTNNDPIVCCSIQQSSSVLLVKSVSTEAEAHKSEYLAELNNNAFTEAQSNFECVVVGITTDNAENMVKLRKLILEEHVISIGSMAHQFYILVKNLTPS